MCDLSHRRDLGEDGGTPRWGRGVSLQRQHEGTTCGTLARGCIWPSQVYLQGV